MKKMNKPIRIMLDMNHHTEIRFLFKQNNKNIIQVSAYVNETLSIGLNRCDRASH